MGEVKKIRILIMEMLGDIFTFSFVMIALSVGCLTGVLMHYGVLRFSPERLFTINSRRIINQIAANPAVAEVLDFPDHVYEVFRTFANVTNSEKSYVDLIKKYIEVHNFSVTPVVEVVTLQDEDKEDDGIAPSPVTRNDNKLTTRSLHLPLPALFIRKVRLEWDTYDHPCYKIYVKDVSYTFEFTKHPPFLHSNWDELKEQGFPPPPPPEEEQKATKKKKDNIEEAPFTIGSLHLAGHLTLKVMSRPFRKEILKSIKFDMDTLKDLFDLIDKKGTRVRKTKDGIQRRGLTPDELGALIEGYFKQQIIGKLKSTTTFFRGGATWTVIDNPSLEPICPLVKDQSVPWIKGIGGGESGNNDKGGTKNHNVSEEKVATNSCSQTKSPSKRGKQRQQTVPDYVPTVNWFGGGGTSQEKKEVQ